MILGFPLGSGGYVSGSGGYALGIFWVVLGLCFCRKVSKNNGLLGSFHRFDVRHTIYLACETGRNAVEAAEEQGEKCAKGAEAIHGPSVAWSVAGARKSDR